jgi:hypothetical protein
LIRGYSAFYRKNFKKEQEEEEQQTKSDDVDKFLLDSEEYAISVIIDTNWAQYSTASSS